MARIKKCIICGGEFKTSPSAKKVTCSTECRKKYAVIRSTGRRKTEEEKAKISSAHKGKDSYTNRMLAVEASKKSPLSGKFETNVNAIDWHIVSPDNVHYRFHSLKNWLRINGEKHFGCKPDTRKFYNVVSGMSQVRATMLGKRPYPATYKGWRVIIDN